MRSRFATSRAAWSSAREVRTFDLDVIVRDEQEGGAAALSVADLADLVEFTVDEGADHTDGSASDGNVPSYGPAPSAPASRSRPRAS